MFSQKDKSGFLKYTLVIIFLLSSCSHAQQEEFVPQTTTKTSLPLKSDCPISSANVHIVTDARIDTAQAILDYLDRGGLPEQLETELRALGTTLESYQVQITDLTNDGLGEIVVAINFTSPKVGSLSIYNCFDGAYSVTKIEEGEQSNIELLSVEDLVNSETAEILVARKFFYTDGCDEFVEMYSLVKRSWVSSLKTESSSCETKIELSKDNKHTLLIIEGNRACLLITCGPTRARQWVYEFASDGVKLVHEELLSSSYRIHALEDGEIALRKLDLNTAINAYDRAARDNNLIDVLTKSEQDAQISQNIPLQQMQEVAHDYQTSFAYFREFILLNYVNRKVDAQAISTQLEKLYQGKSGKEFLDLTSYFLDQLESGVSVAEACEVTNEYIAAKYILTTNDFVYNHLNGWGDPQIGEQLCPILNLP